MAAEREADVLSGGLADGQTSDKYDSGEVAKGTKVELEHTGNEAVAREIAKDHLEEIPDYYTRLNEMEQEAKSELGLEKAAATTFNMLKTLGKVTRPLRRVSSISFGPSSPPKAPSIKRVPGQLTREAGAFFGGRTPKSKDIHAAIADMVKSRMGGRSGIVTPTTSGGGGLLRRVPSTKEILAGMRQQIASLPSVGATNRRLGAAQAKRAKGMLQNILLQRRMIRDAKNFWRSTPRAGRGRFQRQAPGSSEPNFSRPPVRQSFRDFLSRGAERSGIEDPITKLRRMRQERRSLLLRSLLNRAKGYGKPLAAGGGIATGGAMAADALD